MKPTYQWILTLTLSALFVACSAEKFVTPEEKANMTTVMEKGKPVATVMTIGDVEGKTCLNATIPERLRNVRVSVDELSSRNNILTMATAEIKPPHPKSLEATFTIRCQKQFRDRPVAVRGTIYRELEEGVDREAIGTFNTVLGSNSMRRLPEEFLEEPQMRFSCDVLTGLPEAPDTMLIYADMEILLMPESADETTLDPATATVESEADQSVMSSNPLRINFLTE